jgi:hypothetical protein
MKGDGLGALALIVVASFVIDRVVSAVLFFALLVHMIPDAESMEAGPKRLTAKRIYKLLYFLLAALLVIGVLYSFPSIRILKQMGVTELPTALDLLVTGLLFVGGAEKLSQFIQAPGGADEKAAPQPEPPPVRVEGSLTLLRPSEQTARTRTTRDFGVPPG